MIARSILFFQARPRCRRAGVAASLCFVVLGLAGSGSWGATLTADRILHTGQIVTVDGNFRIAEALAIRFSPTGSEIMAVGSNTEVLAFRGPDTQLTDLQGRVVIPGLIDSHLHFSLLGIEAAFEADLRRAMSISDVIQGIARLAGRRKPAPGQWLVGRGWDEYKYERPFNRWDIDAVAPNNPVRLERVYRGLAVNTAAFKLMGIRDDDPSSWPEWWFKDPDWFSLDDRIFRETRTVTVNGQRREVQIPTGMFLGNAVRLVTVRAPAPDFDDQVAAVRYGSEEMTRLGVTGIVDPGGGGRVMRAYQEAYRRGWLKFRILQVYEGMWNTQKPEEIAAHFDAIPFQNLGDRFLRWRGTKWQIDGGAGTRSSWVSEPFMDWQKIEGKPNYGYHWADDKTREVQLRQVVDRGWEVHTHATGDQGMRQTVDLYAKLMASIRAVNPNADLRWSVIHAYLPMEKGTHMLAKMAENRIIAAVNPSFIWHQGRSFSKNLGPERMARLQPFRSYIHAGVKIAVGSDYGTSPYSPWIGLYALLTRKDLWGDVHNADETIGLDDALRAMTINNAYLTYSDEWTGSLEAGKVADLVVLELKDIKELQRNPERIWDMERSILLTLVDGRPAFQREGFRF